MKSRILLLLVFSVFSVTAFAQTAPWSQQGKRVRQYSYRTTNERHWYSGDKLSISHAVGIKIFGSDLLDPDESVLNVGAEYFFADRFGVEVAAGMGLSNRPWLARDYVDGVDVTVDYRIGIEPRLYWNNKEASRYYFALNGWYRRKEMYMELGTYTVRNNIEGYSFRGGNLNQDIAGLAFLFGRQFFIGDHITIDLAIGLGYMTFNNYFSNLKNVERIDDFEYYSMLGLMNTSENRNQFEHGAGGLYLPSHIKLGFVLP